MLCRGARPHPVVRAFQPDFNVIQPQGPARRDEEYSQMVAKVQTPSPIAMGSLHWFQDAPVNATSREELRDSPVQRTPAVFEARERARYL
ncbi:hypothetical protein C8Q76DRAFT_713555 [Earliella scabrosa]|nr:hypothetical protein C8Q76DRAFT_713555 [Earliella scabrosa]